MAGEAEEHVVEPTERKLTPREEAMAGINKARLSGLSEEIVQGGGADPGFASIAEDAPAADAAADQPVEPEAAAVVEDELAKQTRKFSGDPTKTIVTVNIDGEEMELPLSQVLANTQKAAAADKRLTEANRLLAEAKALKDTPAAPAPAASPAAPAISFKDVSTALFEGDEEKAGKAFEDAVAERVDARVAEALKEVATGKPADVASITASVKQQLAWETALTESQDRYPQLYSDPDVQAVGAAKIAARINEGIDPVDALREVQTQMAQSFGWTEKKEDPQPVAPIDRDLIAERAGKKKGIEMTPTASVRRAGDAPEADPPMDAEDRAPRGIAQLRAGRPGQVAAA